MEQFIVDSPDGRTSLLLKELFRKMNLAFISKKNEEISEEEKNIVLNRLKNSKEEDDLD